MDPFTLTFMFLFGAATLAYFWDEIKEWAVSAIRSIINGIDQAINVVSDGTAYLSRQAGKIYKRVEVYSLNTYSQVTKQHIRELLVPEDDVPEEVREQLKRNQKLKVGIVN